MKTNIKQHPNSNDRVDNRLADDLYTRLFNGSRETTTMSNEEKEGFIKKEQKQPTGNAECFRSRAREAVSKTIGFELEPETNNTSKPMMTRCVRYAAAAVILAVALTGSYYAFRQCNDYARRTASAGKYITCKGDTAFSLSDGTSIHLQGGSKMMAAHDFGHSTRRITLSGQAYIHAATDSTRPYIVDMPHGLQLQVRGTSFNINAYADNPTAEITVTSGKVEIGNKEKGITYGVFVRGDRLVYNANTGHVERSRANIDEKTAWMKREILFDKATEKEFAQKMFDVFGKTVIVEQGAFGQEPVAIHASFRNVKNLTYKEVIADLQQLYKFKYTTQGNTIILSPKK